MTYKYYTTAGEVIDIVTKKPLELSTLQTLIGGYIESMEYRGKTIYFNEEGLRLKLASNPFFSHIVGNVIEGSLTNGIFVGNDTKAIKK